MSAGGFNPHEDTNHAEFFRAGHQLGKTETQYDILREWQSQPIDRRLNLSWPAICKLACKAMTSRVSFEDMCINAVSQYKYGR